MDSIKKDFKMIIWGFKIITNKAKVPNELKSPKRFVKDSILFWLYYVASSNVFFWISDFKTSGNSFDAPFNSFKLAPVW